MGFFENKNADDYDNAVANVKDLGAKASKHDREMAANAAKQAGSRGNDARRALGKDK